MILFKPEMAQAILEGRKTVTRRRWKKARVKVGTIHACYTKPPYSKGGAEPFARVRIVSILHEIFPMAQCGGSISNCNAEARSEGFRWWDEFVEAYADINGPAALFASCWRVEFEVVN